jgi:hypothetical protein
VSAPKVGVSPSTANGRGNADFVGSSSIPGSKE